MSKRNAFWVILNDAKVDSWPDVVWRDARNAGAHIIPDFCKPIPKLLRNIRKIHFANISNNKFWLPFKSVWNFSCTLKVDDLNPQNQNYIIFQTGIKFSPHFIKRLKSKGNARIILYMPDNIRTMGIAQSKSEFDRYCKYYLVDQVYSFDKRDCEEFGCYFFDFYSKMSVKSNDNNEDYIKAPFKIFYVGSCRNIERLKTLHLLYNQLKDKAKCSFYINGVSPENATQRGINYNQPLSYVDVVRLVQQSDVIVEIMNGTQQGNTLRLKEAVCYNKLLLSNNDAIRDSSYYDSRYMQVFTNVDEIDLTKFQRKVDYHYKGDFSTKELLKMIVKNDKRENL